MIKYKVSAYAASNVGNRRSNNEDNYYLNHQNVNSSNESYAFYEGSNIVCSVCDGMGGESAGEVASLIVVKTIEEFEEKILADADDATINAMITDANTKVCNEIKSRKKRIGTTFTLLSFNKGIATISNIGDSRVYRFTDNCLEQISKDHTEAQSMVESGIVSKEESMKLKQKHVLTQHLGIFPHEMIIEPYTVRHAVNNNERFLLCSDGLTDMLTDAEIAQILSEKKTPKEAVDELIKLALEHGGKDNVTVIVCDIEKEKNDNLLHKKEKPMDLAGEYQRKNRKIIYSIIIIIAVVTLALLFSVLLFNRYQMYKFENQDETTLTNAYSETSEDFIISTPQDKTETESLTEESHLKEMEDFLPSWD